MRHNSAYPCNPPRARMIHKFIPKQNKRPRFEHRLAGHQQWPNAVETSAPAFYIQTPPFTPQSGGIIACHVLCHELNRLGYETYVNSEGGVVSGTLWTP